MAAITGRSLLQVSKQFSLFYRSFFINFGNNLSRHASKAKEETHIYKRSMNNRDVINYLVKNVAFENEDWIVTNKPYGVGLSRPLTLIEKYNARTLNDVYLKELLPLLCQEFNVNSLHTLFSPERFTSGVTIFGKTTESIEKFKEYQLQELKRSALQYGFLAVTLFEPVPKAGEKKFKLQFDKENKAVEVSSKKSLGRVIVCSHELRDLSEFCSLLEVKSNKLIHNCVSVYLEKECLSPVLGGVLMSVSKIGNVSFPVVASRLNKDSENLNPELLSQLQLHEKEASLIPKHLHLKSLTMKIKKNEEFFVSVPPPDSFLWTCERLKLSLNENFF